MQVRYLAHMAYMPNLMGIFDCGIYLEITFEVKVAVVVFWYICGKSCVLIYMWVKVGPVLP